MSLSALFVVTHLLGVGHLARTAAIARAMARRGHRVTLASGGEAAPTVDMDGLHLVQLEPVHCENADFSRLLDAHGRPVAPELLARRQAALLDAFDAARPDVVVIELFPFGRRQLAGEFLALLEACRERRPRPAVACSIRDVLNPPSKRGRAAEALERLGAWYDLVLVHGDPEAAPLQLSWPVEPDLARRLVYTGYVGSDGAEAGAAAAEDDGGVIVSGGGGAAGLPLLRAAAEAARTDPQRRSWRILAGHGVPEADFAALRGQGGERVLVERARRDFPVLLARASVSVSQAGYNTVMDLAAARARAVVVPFEQGAEKEQRLRAEGFARTGLLDVLPEAELSPQSLLAAVDRAAQRTRPVWSVRGNGAECSCAALEQAAERARRTAHAWDRLDRALARLHAAGLRLDVWWRDDDCVAPSPALDRLLALSARHSAPVALATIPATVEPALAPILARHRLACVLQHGYAHANHAPPEAKKQELGYAPTALVVAELEFGRERLEALFGERFLPILVPPWNRIAPDVTRELQRIGVRGLSTFKRRESAWAAPGVYVANTHLDPIDWRGSRGLADVAGLVCSLAAHAADLAEGRADPEEAYGLLTHHLVHDGWIWRFLEDLLGRLAVSPAARFVSAREAFGL
ncbi:glycosyl transferase family 28 [Alsobacter soli]|uniref:Glycosyl transferase family 28 n=1 Tax=Alsobacter soli TaxID=2109933 RepID=A0A2T1HSJ8_9HYPH|nr:glycosyltransferase [Alsobacter soli]PSC04624.1 glycosyl transferase family 28 [Alsobacter soli]